MNTTKLIAVTALLFARFAGFAAAGEIQDVVANAKPAVLMLFVYNAKHRLVGQATGFAVNHGGDVLTNCHVVNAGPYYEALTSTGERLTGGAIKIKDPINDAAVLHFNIQGNPCLEFAN